MRGGEKTGQQPAKKKLRHQGRGDGTRGEGKIILPGDNRSIRGKALEELKPRPSFTEKGAKLSTDTKTLL